MYEKVGSATCSTAQANSILGDVYASLIRRRTGETYSFVQMYHSALVG